MVDVRGSDTSTSKTRTQRIGLTNQGIWDAAQKLIFSHSFPKLTIWLQERTDVHYTTNSGYRKPPITRNENLFQYFSGNPSRFRYQEILTDMVLEHNPDYTTGQWGQETIARAVTSKTTVLSFRRTASGTWTPIMVQLGQALYLAW